MDDEEDFVKKEISKKGKAANDIAKETKEASSILWPTYSFGCETDSDTDISLRKDTPWKTTRRSPVMTKSSLVYSNDEDDEYYSEKLNFTGIRTLSSKEVVQISDIALQFWTPGTQGYDMHD